MALTKGSARNTNGEYNTFAKGSVRKPPIGNYSPVQKYSPSYEQGRNELTPETGLGKRVEGS